MVNTSYKKEGQNIYFLSVRFLTGLIAVSLCATALGLPYGAKAADSDDVTPEKWNELKQKLSEERKALKDARQKKSTEGFSGGDRIIVKYKNNAKIEKRESVQEEIEKNGKTRNKKEFQHNGAFLYELDKTTSAETLVNQLKKKKDVVEYAELDRRVAPGMIPNDPEYPKQWYHTKVQDPLAWDRTLGAGVTVATLDTGVDLLHKDLATSTIVGWNFYNNNSNVTDVKGHGTNVAGVMAALGNNKIGISGVAPASKNIAIRISDPNAYAYWSAMADGIVYAADHGARVANISYVDSCSSQVVNDAAQYMRSKGGVVVMSAGNSGKNNNMAATPGVVCVSATDKNDVRPSWSSFGSSVDVSAPGVSVNTTKKGGSYTIVNGTSFSSPIVAGVYALMFSINPHLSPSQADSIIKSTAKDIGTPGWDMYYGWGRVDAAKAVALAASTTGALLVDTEAPSAPGGFATQWFDHVSVGLVWDYALDNGIVSYYNVFRNGEIIATTTYPRFIDQTVSPDTTYVYEVSAVDLSGNESVHTAPITIATPPAPIEITTVDVQMMGTSSASVSVVLSKLGTAHITYAVDGEPDQSVLMSETLGLTHEFMLETLVPGVTYYYYVQAFEDGQSEGTYYFDSFTTPI